MFTWDNLTPTTLIASSTNQTRVSLGVRAATLCHNKILAKSSAKLVQIQVVSHEGEEI